MKIKVNQPSTLYSIDDLSEGLSVFEEVAFLASDTDAFIAVSGDRAPFHTSQIDAQAAGFKGAIVHGVHVAARFSRLLGMFLPGAGTVIQKLDLNFAHPLLIGEAAKLTVTVSRIIPSVHCVQLRLIATRGDLEVVTGRAQCVFPSTAVSDT